MEKFKIKNIDVYYNYDTRYKNIYYRMYLYLPFNKDLIVPFKFLSNLLSKTNIYYKTEEETNYYLEDLYNTSSSFNYGLIGKTFSLYSSVNVLNPKYLGLDNYDLVYKAIKFNIDSILHPYFNNDDLQIEKKVALNKIDRLKSNKDSYAYYKYNKLIYNGEIQSITGLEDRNFIKNITIKKLKEAYNILLKSQVYIVICGDISKENVIDILSKQELDSFIPFDLNNTFEFIDYDKSVNKNVKEEKEELDIKQTILYVGYRSDIIKNAPVKLRASASIMCQMLGCYFHSDLFRVIREEKNLAYDIQSNLDAKGTLTISAYISKKNLDIVKNIIFEYMNKYQNKEIDENVLKLTVESFSSSLLKDADSVFSPYYELFDSFHGLEPINDSDYIKILESLTIEDIKDAASHFYLDTVYSLGSVK